MWKKIVLAVVILAVVVAEAMTISKPKVEVDPKVDFIQMQSPPAEVTSILEAACMDCHSDVTNYRWYNYVPFVGNWTDKHVREGSKHLNFSVWGTYSEKRQAHKVEEIIEEVKEDKMPLKSYTWTHSDAKLTEDQKKVLTDYFAQLPH